MAEQSPRQGPQTYVRVLRIVADKFMEFEFSIGSPEVFAEMILPLSGFAGFCEDQGAIQLEPRPAETDREGMDWRLADVLRSIDTNSGEDRRANAN